jgi:lysophospholipase L1-like esterase
MENFRTVLKSQPMPFAIGHSDHLMLVGSCFTEHIGERLVAHKFPALTNPFGIVYNPASLVRCLQRLCAQSQFFSEKDIFENAGLWHSWEHHGRFSKPDKDEMLTGLNAAYSEAANFLKKTNLLLLTFGTADVFELRDAVGGTNAAYPVANNHKMPAALFQERRLTVPEVVQTNIGVLQKIKSENTDLQVVLTVSPVRHLRAGAVANQRSKATLVLACEEISRQLDFVHYFPAYELLLDDLRDYRFYATDMVHPSEVAVSYIWHFFADTFFSEETKRLNERIGKIAAAAKHRPFNPDTAEHRAFAQAQLEAIENLRKDWPRLDFELEEGVFRQFSDL